MGVGLYLFYPVFYSDVTDSYRLGRSARVRTDLGGVYFHLIFALGLILGTVAIRFSTEVWCRD
jgi:putative peptide zinc metalloprotease protein